MIRNIILVIFSILIQCSTLSALSISDKDTYSSDIKYHRPGTNISDNYENIDIFPINWHNGIISIVRVVDCKDISYIDYMLLWIINEHSIMTGSPEYVIIVVCSCNKISLLPLDNSTGNNNGNSDNSDSSNGNNSPIPEPNTVLFVAMSSIVLAFRKSRHS